MKYFSITIVITLLMSCVGKTTWEYTGSIYPTPNFYNDSLECQSISIRLGQGTWGPTYNTCMKSKDYTQR